MFILLVLKPYSSVYIVCSVYIVFKNHIVVIKRLTVDGCNKATQSQQNPNLHYDLIDRFITQWNNSNKLNGD